MASLDRFFGGPPLMVLLRLIVLCVVVGLVLSVLGLHPYDLWDRLINLFQRLWYMGFDAVEYVLDYFLLGALIVIPIWIISRLLRMGRGGRS